MIDFFFVINCQCGNLNNVIFKIFPVVKPGSFFFLVVLQLNNLTADSVNTVIFHTHNLVNFCKQKTYGNFHQNVRNSL